MITPAILKRIDIVETKLTPKEWAIRLADEIRKYPTENEFHCSILNYSNAEETPIHRPFFVLNRQAEELHPGHKPEDLRIQYQINRKLRAEYQALKTLIFQSNEKMKRKAEIWKLKSSLQLSIFKTLLLQDQMIMEGAKNDGKDLTEQADDLSFPSMIIEWCPQTLELIIDFYLNDAVVKTIQEKYFDGHPFLFRDVEVMLSETRKLIENMAVSFDEYMEKIEPTIKTIIEEENGTVDTANIAKFLSRFTLDIEEIKLEFDQKSIVEIAEKWAKDAKDNTIVKFLDEMGKHEQASGFLWNLAREEAKALQAAQKELAPIV